MVHTESFDPSSAVNSAFLDFAKGIFIGRLTWLDFAVETMMHRELSRLLAESQV